MTLRDCHNVICWAFLAVIVFAPWAMGCIPIWAENSLVISTLTISILYLIFSILNHEVKYPHWIAILAVIWLLFQGWWMAWNASFIRDPQSHYLIPITHPFPLLPGSLDRHGSIQMMLRLTAFAGVFCIIFSMSQSSLWRKRIIYTIGITAFSLLLFGIIQKISPTGGLWPQYGRNVWPFATYFYHGNAGAFINLTFPIVATLAWRAAFIDSIPITRALWLSALITCVAAAIINSSKASLVIFVAIFFMTTLLVIWFSRKIRIDWRSLSSIFIGLGIVVGAITVVTLSGDTSQTVQRWNYAINSRSTISVGREGVADVLVQLIPMSGTWGFGPNTFSAFFPYASKIYEAPQGYWEFAHEDYLQTLVEWGYAGATAWIILLFGGMLVALWMVTIGRSNLRKRDVFLLSCILLSIGGCAIHSFVDFPMQIASLQFYLAIFFAMAWSSPLWEKPTRIKSEE